MIRKLYDPDAFQEVLEDMSALQVQVLGNVLDGLEKRGVRVDPVALATEIVALRNSELRDLQETPLPASKQHDADEYAKRSAVDGGRFYELTLGALTLDQARVQHEREWARVRSLTAGGMSAAQAWRKIRADHSGGRGVHDISKVARRRTVERATDRR